MIAIVVLVLVVAVVGVWLLNRPPTPTGTVPEGASEATVAYVHDGDTLFLETRAGEVKVRLTGIDAPELSDVQGAESAECWAAEATAELRKLLPEGTRVFTEADREALDQYGRELLYLFKEDGTFVNRALVLAGAAEAIKVGQNDRYWPELQEAQRDAETAGAGMWSSVLNREPPSPPASSASRARRPARRRRR